jgi:hypothetical protein
MAVATHAAKPTAHAPTGQAKPAQAKPAQAPARPRHALPFGAMLQTKLALGPAHDVFERQADSAASHVVANRPGMPVLSAVPMGAGMAQRACSACDEKKTASRIQRKCACGAGPDTPCSCNKEEEHPELQIDRASKGPGERSTDAIGAVQSVVRGPGKPLSTPVRQDMESGFGRSFSHVRIHDTPRAAASAEGIGAHAYTVGNHIAFNQGQYQPGTDSGRFLLAHELAHTVQQSGAPRAQSTRVSQPGDRHEAQADRAAGAAVSGAPMPALSPGGAAIGRYSFDDFLDDAGSVGGAIYDAPGDLYDAGKGVANAIAGVASDVIDTIEAIASAIGSHVSWDGTTAVIDVPELDVCPELDIQMQLSDLGLDPTLYFPVVAGALGIGIVEVIGVLGIEANLDPGFGFKLAGCTFGPGQIRINALSFSPSVTVSGQLSVEGASMLSFGGDLGVAGDLFGIITWPDPPFVLVVPLIGLSMGGTFQLMAEIGGEISGEASAKMGLGGVSSMTKLNADIGVGLDLSYGLYGSLRVLGADLCRVGWPFEHKRFDAAAAFELSTSVDIGTSGLGFSFGISASAMASNPLSDLGFAFDESRLEDDCPICDFLTNNGLMPGQNGINWANPTYQAKLPRLGGPVRDVMQRDPGITSKAKCRGTCGPDCPTGTCNKPRQLVRCAENGDRHDWYTYNNYATCGTHPGCQNHDACDDAAADMPIWGFGGYMIGPMYRVCDLEAICGYSFQQAVTWAGGGKPYEDPRLRYADSVTKTKGCFGPCPETVEQEDGTEVQQTCMQDRELWSGVEVEKSWGEEFLNTNLVTGTVPMPFIGQLWYGANALARADADVFAALGPINLANACLFYDPATKSYTGTADMTLFANVGASASITAALEGFLSDPACFLNWITMRGTLNAGILAQLPSNLTAGVDLYCKDGVLTVLPRAAFHTCLNVTGELNAALDFFLLSFNVWGKEWEVAKKKIEYCWGLEIGFDAFNVGDMPQFNLVSALDFFDRMLQELFPQGTGQDRNRTPARNPLPASPKLLFPCLRDGGGDDDDSGDDIAKDVTCDTPAKDVHAKDKPAHERAPKYTTKTMAIPGGGSAVVGTSMVVKYLGKSIGKGSEPTVQKAIYGNPGIPKEGCFKVGGDKQKKKDSQRFVRGHLLNENVGGPGNDERNLFPITGLANGKHKKLVEQGGLKVVEKVVDDGLLLYYKVTVTGDHTPREITNPTTGVGRGFYEVRSTFLCEVASYNICSDGELRPGTVSRVPINQDFVFHPSGGKPFDTITEPGAC